MGFNRNAALKGVEGIAASQRGRSESYTPVLNWRAGEKKFIRFLMPIEDVPTVDYYPYMVVGYTDDNTPMYRHFISPEDPGAGGPPGSDLIKARGFSSPKRRQIITAVEVEPVWTKEGTKNKITDWNVVEREFNRQDGTAVSVPNVGLIIQSHIFFGPLAVYAESLDLEDCVWEITRDRGDQNTTYVFRPHETAPNYEPDFSDDNVPDLDAYLTELSSADRMREYVAGLPDNHVMDKYASKSKGARRNATPAPAEDAPVASGLQELRQSVRRSTKATD